MALCVCILVAIVWLRLGLHRVDLFFVANLQIDEAEAQRFLASCSHCRLAGSQGKAKGRVCMVQQNRKAKMLRTSRKTMLDPRLVTRSNKCDTKQSHEKILVEALARRRALDTAGARKKAFLNSNSCCSRCLHRIPSSRNKLLRTLERDISCEADQLLEVQQKWCCGGSTCFC